MTTTQTQTNPTKKIDLTQVTTKEYSPEATGYTLAYIKGQARILTCVKAEAEELGTPWFANFFDARKRLRTADANLRSELVGALKDHDDAFSEVRKIKESDCVPLHVVMEENSKEQEKMSGLPSPPL